MNYMGKLAVINYKIDNCTRNYKASKQDKYFDEYTKLIQDKEELEGLIEQLYYTFQNSYNIHKIIEFCKDNKLNKFDTIKHLDYLYERLFKIKKYYTKQYKNRILEV